MLDAQVPGLRRLRRNLLLRSLRSLHAVFLLEGTQNRALRLEWAVPGRILPQALLEQHPVLQIFPVTTLYANLSSLLGVQIQANISRPSVKNPYVVVVCLLSAVVKTFVIGEDVAQINNRNHRQVACFRFLSIADAFWGWTQ